MKRLLLFALVAVIPLACSSQEPSTPSDSKGQTAAKKKQQSSIDAIVLDSPATTEDNPTVAKDSAAKSEWTQLFNGVDLTGWKTHPEAKGEWRVRNGAIVSYGSQLSHLFTDRSDFENVHLRVEAKIADKGNSGQFVRAKFGKGTVKGYEANISSNSTDSSRTGDLTGFTSPKLQLHLPNEWFIQELIANGNNLKIIFNGKEIVDYTDAKNSYKKGHIAIQHRPAGGAGPGKGGKKGGGGGKDYIDDEDWTVMFKKIEIKELPSGR